MIENWLLADIESINKHYKLKIVKDKFYEGTFGKSEIKKLIKENSYSETEDGPEIFEKLNLCTASVNSISLMLFLEKIAKLQCNYLSDIL